MVRSDVDGGEDRHVVHGSHHFGPVSRARRTVGGLAWFLTVLYFASQPVVISAWRGSHDLARNTISDLGVTECGRFSHLDGENVWICSPRHNLMNATFIAVGLLIVMGCLLLMPRWHRSRAMTAATWSLVLTGVGAVLIGVAPANENLSLHGIGVVLQVPGSFAPLLAGIGLSRRDRSLAAFSFVTGAVGTIATVLFLLGVHLGLGVGGMEHLAFDPLIIWLVVVGVIAAA